MFSTCKFDCEKYKIFLAEKSVSQCCGGIRTRDNYQIELNRLYEWQWLVKLVRSPFFM